MFDFGFSEIMVIAVVALIVIGPERLPAVARTLGHLMGRMQRYVNDVKADIQREVELDELRELRKDVEDSARSIEDSLTADVNAVQDELRGLDPLVNPDAENARQSPAASPSAIPAAQNGAEAAPAASTPKNA
jgi:sec-independent protein translocase protein TatB